LRLTRLSAFFAAVFAAVVFCPRRDFFTPNVDYFTGENMQKVLFPLAAWAELPFLLGANDFIFHNASMQLPKARLHTAIRKQLFG